MSSLNFATGADIANAVISGLDEPLRLYTSATTNLTVDVTGVGSIPGSAQAITGTLTAVAGSSAGYAALFACEEAQPNTSTLNLTAGQTIANAVIGALDTSGDLCLYTSVSANYLLDISGWLVASR